jgi:hypothetical protein
MSGQEQSVDTVEELVERHGSKLRNLVGHAVQAVWIAWDNEQREWFADEAVIIDVGPVHLEVACWKFSDIILSWGAIDLGQRPAWVADWGGLSLTWRSDVASAADFVLSRPITGVNIIEYLWRTTVVQDRKNPANVGQRNASWLLHGLELECSGTNLIVFNDLDKNGLANELPKNLEFRKTRLA